jgi:four helix bundle protein
VSWRTGPFLFPSTDGSCPRHGTVRLDVKLRTANCERDALVARATAGYRRWVRRVLTIGFVDAHAAFALWEADAEPDAPGDRLWRMTAYRMAVYAMESGWDDVGLLDRNRLTRPIAAQLYRALGSIAATVAEGYSRSSGRDRARFFEYGLGSARESRVWYRAARPVLGADRCRARTEMLSQICALLVAAIPPERSRQVRPRPH